MTDNKQGTADQVWRSLSFHIPVKLYKALQKIAMQSDSFVGTIACEAISVWVRTLRQAEIDQGTLEELEEKKKEIEEVNEILKKIYNRRYIKKHSRYKRVGPAAKERQRKKKKKAFKSLMKRRYPGMLSEGQLRAREKRLAAAALKEQETG